MSTRIAHANALKAAARAALDAAELPQVIATLDPADIPSGSREGVVVITPPDIDFATWATSDVTFELIVVAGPAYNYVAAWQRLDAIVKALQESPDIRIASGRADGFTIKDVPTPLPGYTLTLHPDTISEEE